MLICFNCMQRVLFIPALAPSGKWIAKCTNCGITNQLVPHPDVPDTFSVASAFIDEQQITTFDASKDIIQRSDGSWNFRKDYLKRLGRAEPYRIIRHLSDEWERFFGREENAEHKPRD